MDDDTALLAARRRLEGVTTRLAAHPLRSDRFVRARTVVRERPGDDRAAVSAALRAEGLPSLGQQARTMALGLVSLARLNRRRLRLERQISALEAARPR